MGAIMENLPYIKRQFDFSPYVALFNQLFDEIDKVNPPSFKEMTGKATSTIATNMINPHEWDELNELLDVGYELSQLLFGTQSKTDYQKSIYRSWSNRYWATGCLHEHTHDGVDMVLSCYVNKPKDSGNFELFYNNTWNTIPVETNDILVFPGSLLHRTEMSKSSEPRIIISINHNHFAGKFGQIQANSKKQATNTVKKLEKNFNLHVKEFENTLCNLS
jgi:hypothetical protein